MPDRTPGGGAPPLPLCLPIHLTIPKPNHPTPTQCVPRRARSRPEAQQQPVAEAKTQVAQVTNQRARVCVRAHSNIARALPLGTPVPSAANASADLHRQDTPSLRRCPSVCLFRSRPRCRSGSSVVLPRCATPAGGTCERREARLGEIAPNGPHCRGACWCRCRLLLVAQCSASVRPVVLSQRTTIEPTKPHVRPSATL